MLKTTHTAALFIAALICSFASVAEEAYFSVSTPNGTVTLSTEILYAQDVPYVSLGRLFQGLGGAVRISDDAIQANYGGITALLRENSVAVSTPTASLSLIHPARAHNGDIFIARNDVPDFFARLYRIQPTPTAPPQVVPTLTPIAPDDELIGEEPDLLLDSLLPPPIEETVQPLPEEAVEGEQSETDDTEEDAGTVQENVPPTETPSLSGISGAVVLDPGHGGQDAGIVIEGDIAEKSIVLDVALRIRRILKENSDTAVHLTRDDDRDVQFGARAKAAESAQDSVLISIHAGFSASPRTNGVILFTDQPPGIIDDTMSAEMRQALAARRTHGERAAVFSQRIAQHLATEGALGPVTLRTAPLTLQRLSGVPCIVIELTYLSHPDTAAALADENFLEATANTLAGAIVNALEQENAGT